MMKATLKPISVEYLQWNDNLTEMKFFCLDNCQITYEYAPGIDCYWNLQIWDCYKDKLITVPLNAYVVKILDGFIMVRQEDFDEYFDRKLLK